MNSSSKSNSSWLKRFFAKMSLKKKIISLIAGVSFVVVFVAMLASFIVELSYFRDRLTHEYHAAAKMLSRNLEAAVLFENEKDCRDILSHLETYKTIANAAVYTVSGELLGTFQGEAYKENLAVPSMTELESVEGRWILISNEIQVDGTNLGVLIIRADSGELYKYLLSRIGVLLLLLIVAIFLAWLLGLKLSKYISEPITELTKVANSISNSKDFSQRQERVSMDETGDLVDAFNGMMEDIESRNAVISASEERFRRYFELGVVGMAVLDEQLQWIDFNETLVEILGYERRQLEGTSFFSKMAVELEDPSLAELYEFSAGSNSGLVSEYWMNASNNRKIFVLASFKSVADPESGKKQFILLLQDITERKRHEEELIHAKERAEESSRTKDEFLSIMSHELRTPLNPILGFSELLRGQLEDPEDLECVQIISKSASHLLDLIGDILDYTRIDRGIDRIEKASFDYVSCSIDVLSSFKMQAGGKGVDLIENHYVDGVAVRLGQKIVVSTDQVKFKQLLQNIVANALKFTQQGCISVSSKLSVAGRVSPLLRIEVHDTGIGIENEDRVKVFGAFSQIDGSMTRRYGGIGLGMAICKKMVEAMGGRIDFTSTVGVGTRFWFELPVALIEMESAIELPSRPIVIRQMDELGKGAAPVLLVEDDPSNRQLATLLIKSRGFDVVVAENGERAVSLSEQKQFSLIFMDLQMPVLDGYDATRQIRRNKTFNQLAPIIALTAHADESVKKNCESVGMSDFLAKPFKPEQFMEKLNKWSASSA